MKMNFVQSLVNATPRISTTSYATAVYQHAD